MASKSSKYEAVIGLEVHAQMKTKSKAFCSCSTEFNAPPNTNVCPVCLGHPGALPVLNKKLVDFILKLGLATECKITEHSIFARKNYFYPDLPKGYQISQHDRPICHNGSVVVNGKKIGINRIHMEEDAGKSIHNQEGETLIDLNRCGIPLVEIVSEADIRSSEEANNYLFKIKQLVRYLDICDGNMEEGSLRCDANVSIRIKGDKNLGTKTEIKNLNSFKNVADALNSEIKRQADILEKGEKVLHQTLSYDAKKKKTVVTRTKEEAYDYRYFQEPDLLKVYIDEKWINAIRETLPELPDKRKNRFISQYHLPEYNANVLTQDISIADYFENVCKELKNDVQYKNASNWIMTEILRILNENKIVILEFTIKEKNFSSLIRLVDEGIISNNIAKEVFSEMLRINDPYDKMQEPEYIIKLKNLGQVSDESDIENILIKVLDENKNEVSRYRNGETKLLDMFVGKIMKESEGKANPKIVNELLLKKLKK